jgi:hypothetical protein
MSSFGLWLGTYQSVNIFLTRSRKKSGILNSIGAGFVAGSVASLSTRNPMQIMVGGMTSGALMGIMGALGSGGL